MEICAYSPALRSFFKTLNEEWLNKYFVVEPYDAFLLENCSEEIIDKGGKIFFGKLNGAVIGTYAILAVLGNGKSCWGNSNAWYRGFTHSFMKVTSRHSFTLFRPFL